MIDQGCNMGDRKTYIINQIAKYSQKLDQKGFGANHDGNISAKFEDVILATPTAVSKGDIVPDIVITLDHEGKKIAGIGNPFSEIKLHLTAYQARPDVKAVVHAHPPFATARGLVGLPLYPMLPEAIVSIGDIVPATEFAMPGAPENDAIVKQALEISDVFMLSGNGVIAVGDNIEQAYLRLELVEHLAKIQYYAENMGAPLKLVNQDIGKLLEKRASIGLGPQGRKKTINNITFVAERDPEPQKQSIDVIKDLIAKEIRKAMIESND